MAREEGDLRVPVRELVGVHEVAEILDVKNQRVGEFEARRRGAEAAGNPNPFPAPVWRLAMGPIWLRSEVEAFDQVRRTTPGPAPGTVARRPSALSSLGVPDAELERTIGEPRTGLSERERQVLRMRLGLLAGARAGGKAPAAEGRPLGQRAVAEEIGVSLPTVKLAQRRAVEKVLGALGRPPEGGRGS